MRSLLPAALILFVACTKDQVSQEPPKAAAKAHFEALVVGDLGSDTEECGCKAREMGGIARRAKVVLDKDPKKTLVLDAGDHFYRTPLVSPRDEAQAKETAHFLARSMQAMNVAAMAVGERDLAFGLQNLRALEKESGAKFLSANLIFAASSTLAFAPYAIVERDGAKIGIVGASLELDPKAAAHVVYAADGLATKPLEPALIEAAQAARKAGAAFVIGLVHAGDRRTRDAITKLEGGAIDLVFASHDRSATNVLELLGPGPTGVVSSGERGKWVVQVAVDVAPNAKGVANAGAIEDARRSVKEIEARIGDYKKTEGNQETIDRLERRKSKIEAELASATTAGRHALAFTLIPLDVALPEEPKMLAAFNAFKDQLRVVNAGIAPLAPGELTYVGTNACKDCHKAEHAQWLTTGHAKAWATMVKTKQTGNLDCVGCHTTGFDRPGGPRAIAGLEAFADVGCESCHGPGAGHLKNPRVKMDHGKKVPERVCAECHRAQADQKPFNFEERLPKVAHRATR